jgi:hypothetical protein
LLSDVGQHRRRIERGQHDRNGMMKHLDPTFARSLLAGPRHVPLRANVVGDVAIETLL